MVSRPLRETEKEIYNQAVDHPLQSWEWGEFRHQTGIDIERVGFFDGGKLKKAIQVSFHPIPLIHRYVGYLPKSYMPDEDQLVILKELGKKHRALFVKIEPNVAHPIDHRSEQAVVSQFILDHGAVYGRPLFTKYTFQIDLTQTEAELFANLTPKTRYNVRLAIKKGVTIVENTSKAGMETYLEILKETTRRQGFYAHSPEYFRTMWQTLGRSGMIRIFQAVYEKEVLASWIMFVFHHKLYYPYGASSAKHRNVMASNLMMWEMIKFGQQMKCDTFDLWGALGPNASKKNPWYGFHRFKAGYGGQLMEFLGTFDVLVDPPVYQIYTVAENLRWKILKLKAKLGI